VAAGGGGFMPPIFAARPDAARNGDELR